MSYTVVKIKSEADRNRKEEEDLQMALDREYGIMNSEVSR